MIALCCRSEGCAEATEHTHRALKGAYRDTLKVSIYLYMGSRIAARLLVSS